MKYIDYLRLLFFSIFITHSNVVADLLETSIIHLPLKTQNIYNKFDKKIKNQKEVLEKIIKDLEVDPEVLDFFSFIKEKKEALEKESLYIKIKTLTESLNLLDELKNYNQHLINPILLQRITTSLYLPILQAYDSLLSLLRKERIHMLEMNDEYILLQTFFSQISTIEMELNKTLKEVKIELEKTELLSLLQKKHLQYLKNKNIILLNKAYEKLWNIVLDRESKLLKNIDYQNYVLDQKISTYNCQKELQEIIEIKKSYYLDGNSFYNIEFFL